MVRDPKSEVTGAIVGGLSARDVARLAAYEGPRYRIAPLKVRIAGMLSIVSVFAPLEERFQPTSGSWELTSLAASAQAGVPCPRKAGAQRVGFQAVTWIAEQ